MSHPQAIFRSVAQRQMGPPVNAQKGPDAYRGQFPPLREQAMDPATHRQAIPTSTTPVIKKSDSKPSPLNMTAQEAFQYQLNLIFGKHLNADTPDRRI